MMCLTEGKHRGTEKPPGTRTQRDFKEKSQELRVGKFIRRLGQGSGRQWKEMREWRQAPVDLPFSLFFCCCWPLHLLSFQAAEARWDRLASAAQSPAPPSEHHLGIHTPNGASTCSCHSGVCVILDLLLQFWCPVSQPWHWTCIKTSHSTAESTRISARGKPDAGRDAWTFIPGVHSSRTVLQTVTDVLKHLRGPTPPSHTAFI